MDEILRAVNALQTTDKYKVSAPANWPKNELIGEDVIIPPPADEKTARTRVTGGDIVCYDWWYLPQEIMIPII